jgi:DNA polymerase I-like protein with 3'-5' exonuclease and polymerase domains
MAEEKEYDLYERIASVIFDVHLEEVTRDQRNTAKSLTWSWGYSMRTPSDELLKRHEAEITKMIEMRSGINV